MILSHPGLRGFSNELKLSQRISPEYINIEIALRTAPVTTRASGSVNPMQR